MNILYIVRGIPGSGKSTLIKKITKNIVELDDYYNEKYGYYKFSYDEVPQSHKYALNKIEKMMIDKLDEIAVIDSFIKNKDFDQYKKLAIKYNYKPIEIIVHSDFKDIHNVPIKRLEEMCNEFEFIPIESEGAINNNMIDRACEEIYAMPRMRV